jgi:hypothetical protein
MTWRVTAKPDKSDRIQWLAIVGIPIEAGFPATAQRFLEVAARRNSYETSFIA